MNYEEFKEKFVEDIKDSLYEQGIEANVTIREMMNRLLRTRMK